MRINKGLLVELNYRLEEESGALIEETTAESPLVFIYGMALMLPAFEAQLTGMVPGDEFDFVLSPDEAYGTVKEDLKIDLSKEVFYIDGKFDEEVVYEGARVPMNTADGMVVHGLVTAIEGDTVKMDFNHDLAGKTLHFTGSIKDVREPSQEEYDNFFGEPEGCSGCSGCGDHDHEGGCGGCGC